MIKDFIQLMRVQQYIKNLFIFLPLFFGFVMSDLDSLLRTAAAFVLFCLVASAVYIFNDYRDCEDDRKHPVKRDRPLAAGRVSQRSALIVMAMLAAAGCGGAVLLNRQIFYLMLIYIAMNVLYTMVLKHLALIDVMVIAVGFVLRLFVGSIASDVALSMWIIIMTFLLALFLAFGKRREDVFIYLEKGQKARKSIDGYNIEFLNVSMIIMATVTVIAYIMYTISPNILMRAHAHSDKIYLTVLWVIMGILRYLQKSFVYNDTGSPTRVLLTDRFLQLVLLGWIVSFGLLIYL